ncbi:SIS domain-containing protein [Arsenicicoccus sp. oral taxon 190]|uniref:SIS domain-containing protein n=1 Tax=Arsenicicoccus sp. oral taxon 190 TaxID=1658671 RepID=UPI00067A3F1A|nr:SIS domain-containing protein [Arsenicicoccus sp. oral taxon 190]AKT50437.1 glutamine--fructose-6-phosphate aminotransferase [Arsenicicoccus sp. oral taxon 190]
MYSSQMLREIQEQPQAADRTIESLLPLREEIARVAAGRRHVMFSARGSSDNAGLYGRYLLETYAGRPAAMLAPSVFTHYRAPVDLDDTVVVTVSQSGGTQELVETQAMVRERGAATIAVTNVADSPLAAEADLALVTQAGPEIAVPATKTYLTQTIAMAVLATALAPEPEALDDRLRGLPGELAEIIERGEGVDEAACALVEATGPTIVTGRGLLLGTALETALKIEETCLRPVRGYSYADLRHGPIAVVRPGAVAVLVCAEDGPMVEPLTELAGGLTERGATVVGIGGAAGFVEACALHVPTPRLPETLAPIGTIVPAQLVVERLAARLGLDPDNPRGLAKVTQTDADSSTDPRG